MRVKIFRARILGAVVMVLLAAGIGDARLKTDILSLDNGDTITCEIKQMEQGLVSVKTDYLRGTVAIKWIHVQHIETEQLFEVEAVDGSKYFGAISAADSDLTMTVVTNVGDITVAHGDVVRIAPIDETFWQRLRGDVDFGLTAKKANDEKQYNLAASMSYRTREYRVSANVSSFVSLYGENPSTARHDLSIGFRRALRGKWFWSAATKFENNQELGLDLRTTLAGGGGRFIIQNNHSELSWTAGLAGNEEWYAGAEDPKINLEGFLLLEYLYFLFGNHETSISISGIVMPSFSSSDRVRYSLDAKYRHEFVKDLYFALGLVADYDSEPPVEAERTDWNFTTSLGYSF